MGANNLKDIRKSKGLTMMDKAEILGYKYAGSYRKLETGEQELIAIKKETRAIRT